ncbi:MAG: ABC transporter ATP-binding protein, partial [Planctomycetota bacterium]
MGTIQLQDVTVQFGGRVVLDAVSLELHGGRTVGVVGPNGAGKTTLFRVIRGVLAPDAGRVSISKGMRVGYLSQEPDVDPQRTLHDEALSAFDDLLELEQRMQRLSEEIAARHDSPDLPDLMRQYDRLNERFVTEGGYEHEQRLHEILGGLGFQEADYKLPIRSLSGGQQCRAALAKLLLQDHSYLLLDEPTNHLDIDAVRWLERFLASHQGGAAIISHDRYLLDRLAESIIEVDHGRIRTYAGNYSAYREIRARQELTQQREYEKDQAFIAKERELAFEFDVDPLPGRTMIDAREVAKAYDGKTLFAE